MDVKVKSYNHYREETKYTLSMVFTVISMLVCVIFAISFIAIGANYAAYLQIIGAFIFMMLSGMLRKRIQSYTRFLAIMTSMLFIAIQGMLVFGSGYGFHFQLFPLLVVIFLLLDFNTLYERVSIYLFSFIAIVIFYAVEFSPFTPIFKEYLLYEKYYYSISLFISFAGLLVVLYYLSKEIFSARDQLYNMATTDVLTNLYNRRTFLKRGKEAFKIAERGGDQFAVIIFDIDSFKTVNDEYGHLVGDVVLKSMADISGETIRETDLLARYGGEEFAILLPHTTPEQAQVVAEKLRKKIEEHIVVVKPYKITRTISLGVMGYHFSITSFDDLIDKADKAMYKSKTTGKNKVTTYDIKDAFYKEKRLVNDISR